MRLITVDCLNYKRFRGMRPMDVDPRLVCVVGPNESGKSSLLNALTHLDHDYDFAPNEKTRGAAADDNVQVRARFVLEDADKAAIADIPEARQARQLVLWKKAGFGRSLRLEPAPVRDLARRADVHSRLRTLKDQDWLKGRDEEHAQAEPEQHDSRPSALVEQAVVVTGSEAESLDEDEELSILVRLLDWLQASEGLPHRFRKLPTVIDELIAYEREPHPQDRADEALWANIPRFLLFSDAQRGLAARYTLPEDDDAAIRNLLKLANTSYEETVDVAQSGDKGRKTVWLDRTKEALRARFTTAWRQSDLEVRLDLDGPVLSVLISMQAEDYIEIDQRSDGLRQFVALRAYLAAEEAGPVKPILLIDEAETHLHYDAQADLVQVLEEQDEVAKVIYTTHSAGCLPRDLGTGIRAIVPSYRESDGERIQTDDSEIINKFWTEGRGFSPILIAMGASALAFAAARRAVIGEGMTETLLLPALLREATGQETLDYQVAPHFADATTDEVADLDLVAARVVYLVDGDKGGADNAKTLRKRGVLEGQIVFLGGKGSGLSLEDLLVREVYLTAINAELERWHAGVKFDEDLPDTGRSAAVTKWCQARTTDEGRPLTLSKVDVAQRVLDQRQQRDLVAPTRRDVLRRLDAQLRATLDRPTTKVAADAASGETVTNP